MNILNKITAHKKKEVEERIKLFPNALLEKSIFFQTDTVSLKKYLLKNDKSGIIAEFKKRSPSKGAINAFADIEKVSISYMQAGASALSVLTDTHFFGGKNEDLSQARKFNYCPILRKDFVIDEYQILEAKSIGADAVLLIAECLTQEELKKLASLAKSLKMEVLMEVHSLEQLAKLNAHIDVVGINNRDLSTFQVDINTSLELAEAIPEEFLKISESGISDAQSIVKLKESGFQGFLIGEHFMTAADPGKKCLKFIQEIENLEKNKSLISTKV